MVRAVWLGLTLLGMVLSVLTARTAPTVAAELSARSAPLFYVGDRIGKNLKAAAYALVDRRRWRQEALALERQVAELKQENLRLSLENQRLRRTLKVRESQAPGVVAIAPIIAEDPSGLFRRLTLGLGEADGLRVGMPVTSPGGLVGVIIETTPKRAVVRTVVDPESAIGVRPADVPGRGIARGRPPASLRVRFPVEVEVKPGDLLITGAIGGLFPEGIPVARVTRVIPPGPGALTYDVEARPVVRFSMLEEVIVLRRL